MKLTPTLYSNMRTVQIVNSQVACSAGVFWVGESGNLVRVRNIVVAAIFDFLTVEDWGECSRFL